MGVSSLLALSFVKEEKGEYRDQFHKSGFLKNLPEGDNTLFAGSGVCAGCHGHDPNGLAQIDPVTGNDINVVDYWRSSMMANASKDPFWKAKVSHEVNVNPGHQLDLENKCTSCHAPLGHFNAIHNGQSHYSFAESQSDSLALDGVSCSACHQLNPTTIGQTFSGQLDYDTTKTVWGPYQNPFEDPMDDFIGFNVQYGAHIGESELCASCHTLITETVDLGGNYTGGEFVEQATYHEWVNSRYDKSQDNVSCQDCHMPQLNENVVIAANYAFLSPRRPFGLHGMDGANVFMLQLLKNNMDTLGLTATAMQFDSSIARSQRMLQNQTLDLHLQELNRTTDTAFYELELQNLAGHKFPSGYPSRRAFVQFTVMDDLGDTLFSSGLLDTNYEVMGHDPEFEPHYTMINQEDQVQIYEMVMGDVNGDKTTVLERAADYLKDNRLPPQGFSTSHYAYDTTEIAGNALSDPNFNFDGPTEGTGADKIFYHIPLNGYTGDLNVVANVYYQSIRPGYLQDMFTWNSSEINHFSAMYNGSDRSPILVEQALLGSLFTDVPDRENQPLQIYPNPTADGIVLLRHTEKIRSIRAFDLTGQQVDIQYIGQRLQLPAAKGTYILQIELEDRTITRRVIRQ